MWSGIGLNSTVRRRPVGMAVFTKMRHVGFGDSRNYFPNMAKTRKRKASIIRTRGGGVELNSTQRRRSIVVTILTQI